MADIKISIAPDHRAVRLGIKMVINKRGPDLWKFNNSLLKDQVFITLTENSYPMIKVKYIEVDNARFKMGINQDAIERYYSIRKK